MNTNMTKITSKVLFTGLLLSLISIGCERSVDGLEEASLTQEPNIFTDTFIGMGSDFYFPFETARPDVFSVDDEGFESDASIRFDVPNADDPAGSFAGAIFRVDGSGRDLSVYNALTFYAKASQGVSISEVGFGLDFIEDKFQASASNLSLGTNWNKYVIPIPDPSKLVDERGVFWFSAGTQQTGGLGYTFWIDELKFENLGTIGQPRFEIFNGEDRNTSTFTGVSTAITGLNSIYNLANGRDQVVSSSASYFEFSSTDETIAAVDESGTITTGVQGSAVVTASVGEFVAEGSLTVESRGTFNSAPTPSRDAANVISIFSDAYDNVEVDYYNGFFNGDGQTTQGGTGPGGADLIVDGNGVINYTQLNFVGIGTFLNVPSIDASEMTHLHVDINVNEAIQPGDFIRLQLLNSVGDGETSGSFTINSNILLQNSWIGLDIPLSSFSGLNDRSKIGLTFFISDNTVSDIFVDNIYFFKN